MVNLKVLTYLSFPFFGICLSMACYEVTGLTEYSNTMPYNEKLDLLIQALFSSKLRITSVLSVSVCCILFFGKLLQSLFFGKLRTEESRVNRIKKSLKERISLTFYSK